MDIKTGLATVSLLAMSSLPSFAELRDWLAPPPEAFPGIRDVLKYSDTSINFGSRAGVRVYRPEGIYELRNGRYELSPSEFGGASTETTDD